MPPSELQSEREPVWSPADLAVRGESGLLPAWLRNLWLFRIPAAVPSADHRVYRIRLILVLIAISMHFGLAILFLSFGQSVLALVNVGSILWYVFVVAVMRTGRVDFALALGFAEAYAHGFIFTLLLGLGAGYVFYNFAFLVVAFVAYRRQEGLSRVIMVILAIAIAVSETIALRLHPPLLRLEPWETELLLYMNIVGSLFAGAGSVYYFATVSDIAEARLAHALFRSDQLLLNILPAPIAERLKQDPGTIADVFPSVTVLFADIVGFTTLSARLSSKKVVDMLNEIFSAFDRCAERHGGEKIKTIGDAYMAVGGLPEPRADHAARVAALALDIQTVLRDYSVRIGLTIAVRVGIHSGPVVAGVIGRKKFAYDIWGDTVNTASRMETNGVAGEIQVSEATYDHLKGSCRFKERGLIEVKGKGKMRTYFLLECPASADQPNIDWKKESARMTTPSAN